MFFLDDSDESDADISPIEQFSTNCFVELMKLKPFLIKTVDDNVELALTKTVGILAYDDNVAGAKNLRERLLAANFQNVILLNGDNDDKNDLVDSIVLFDLTPNDIVESMLSRIVAGGHLLVRKSLDFASIPGWTSSLKDFVVSSSNGDNGLLRMYTRQGIQINTEATVYWQPDPSNEQRLLEKITINLTTAERNGGVFSDVTHRRVVENLRIHGLCVFAGLFERKAALEWGAAAVADMERVVRRLRERGTDLLEVAPPATAAEGSEEEAAGGRAGYGKQIENYHEMSMREARRCDIRNGRHMRRMQESSVARPGADLRSHEGLLAALTEAASHPGGEFAAGNWGRWNFEGPGPEAPPAPLKVGSRVGAVVSLPGCTDQTIHADTAHVFDHVQLPGHYFNLFVCAADPGAGADTAGTAVGQTAFAVGTHQLQASHEVMVSQGEPALLRRLVRPHLAAGDALVFDCRTLHLGLANRHPNNNLLTATIPAPAAALSTPGGLGEDVRGWRALLYINYHHSWFVDPKNWNDNEKLFGEGDE